MPCCSCTTGSPMRTSERSRSIASTFERRAASRLPRRTTPAYSSASVTNASRAAGHAKPACNGATTRAMRSDWLSPSIHAVQSSMAGTLRP